MTEKERIWDVVSVESRSPQAVFLKLFSDLFFLIYYCHNLNGCLLSVVSAVSVSLHPSGNAALCLLQIQELSMCGIIGDMRGLHLIVLYFTCNLLETATQSAETCDLFLGRNSHLKNAAALVCPAPERIFLSRNLGHNRGMMLGVLRDKRVG